MMHICVMQLQLVMSLGTTFFEIGSALAERVGHAGEGGTPYRKPLVRLGGLFFSCFAQMGLDNHLLAIGPLLPAVKLCSL